MADELPVLVQVAALCQLLLEALERVDRHVAPEALIADLRGLRERAHSELERRAREAGD